MNDNITPRLDKVLKNAKKEAIKLGNGQVELEHVVIAIIDANTGLAVDVLKKTTVPIEKIREELTKKVTPEKKDTGDGLVPVSKALEEVLANAKTVSEKFKHQYVGTEHVLIAILDSGDTQVNKIFRTLGIDTTNLKTVLSDELESTTKNAEPEKVPAGGPKKDDEKPVNVTEPFIKKYAIDLSEKASKGELDPVVGRTAEVKRVISILARKKKNNPVLVGPPGVGKTSIVEGLALRIHEKSVPKALQSKRVFALDMGLMVAGTMYRGQFEERLKKILTEVRGNKDFIVFIDELHTVIGAGNAEGAMDAANMIKPALARGEFTCIGATTIEEYRRYIERDAALERRFQKVQVDEPNLKDTIEILKGSAKSYEAFHGVKYPAKVVEYAATMTNRFITDRYQPDKGFDILDEAGALVKLAHTGPSSEQKDIELKLTDAHTRRGKLMQKSELTQAAEVRNEIAKLEHELSRLKAEDESLTVTEEHVNHVISSWTGIPIGDLSVNERDKLLHINDILKGTIVGQDDAINVVSTALKKYRTPLKDMNRPIGNFLFLGPTGVGKTLLAKTVAKKMFGSEESILELDMSEYAESTAVTKLIGSSAGYVGYEDGAKLCKWVQRKPYSVILFDEIEKAHPDVVQILLQIFENGRLTDNHGKLVDFKNTIIVLTSNLGVQAAKAMGFGTAEQLKTKAQDKMLEEVKRHYKPEFLNRLDIVMFSRLTTDDARKVVGLEIDILNKRLAGENRTVSLTPKAIEFILTNGFNEEYGARNVRKQIEHHIEDALTDDFLAGKIPEGSVIIFDVIDNKLNHVTKEKI